MARNIRSMRPKVLIAAAALVLGPSAVMVGLQVSAGAPSASSARHVARLTATTTLDHFTCYISTAGKNAAGASTFGQPSAVELFNQFSPQGLWSAVGNLAFHCNPVVKTANGVVTPITNKNAHLLCFTTPKLPATAVVTSPTYKVSVSNQFGSAELDTGQPVLLCLPTWKSLTSPPPPHAQVQPPGLSHFLCYTAVVDPNSTTQFAPPPITLLDQFMPKPLNATVLTPNLLCLPTLKQLSPLAGPTPTTNFNGPHLVCFSLKVGTVRPRTVYDQNQFGTGAVATKKLTELCVPSTKEVASPGGQVVITKTDDAGIPLIGATFTAYASSDPSKTTPLGTCTTGAAGVCTIINLPAPGSYIISETTPPSGYSGSPDQTVTIATSPGAAAATFSDCLPSATGGCPVGTT